MSRASCRREAGGGWLGGDASPRGQPVLRLRSDEAEAVRERGRAVQHRKPAAAGPSGTFQSAKHVARPAHHEHTPLLVTMRAAARTPGLRSQVVFGAIERELRHGSRNGLRIVHFSVQNDHVHLVVEADDGRALSRGLQRLASRLAMVVNAVMRRGGRLWRERYHRLDLETPTQVRNAYVYVLMNVRKHAVARGAFSEHVFAELDSRSSARWFIGWHPREGPPPQAPELPPRAAAETPSVVPAKTWLATTGWKRCGLLRHDEIPRSSW